MPLCDVQDRIHVRGLAVQMHRENGLGSLGNRRLDRRDVHRESARIDVDEHRGCIHIVDRGHRCHEGEGDGNDFVATPDVGCEQRQVQGAGSGIHADTVRRLTVGRKLCLECGHFGTERELATVQNALDRGVHLVLDRRVLRLEIDKRNHDVFP